MPQIPFGAGAAIQVAKRVAGVRVDPFLAYNFHLEVDGVIVGGFQEVSGLSVETDVEERRAGGQNDKQYKYVKQTKYPDITLSRGMSDTDMLYGWYYKVQQGKIERKDASIFLLDDLGTVITWWDIKQAYPVKWEGPTLNASSPAVATEKFTLVHQRLARSSAAQSAGLIRSAATGAAGLLL